MPAILSFPFIQKRKKSKPRTNGNISQLINLPAISLHLHSAFFCRTTHIGHRLFHRLTFPASRWMHFSSSETKLDIHVDALAISRSLLFPLLPMQTLHGHCPAYNKHRSLQCLLSHSLLPPPQGWLFLLRQRDLRFYHPAHKSE